MKTPALILGLAIFLLSASQQFAQAPEILWTKTLGGQVAFSVFPSPDGGIVVGGYSTVDGFRDFYISKTDDQGDVLWEYTYGNDDRNESLTAMIQTSDGGFLLVGNRAEDSPYSSYADIFMVKTDGDGIQEWYSIIGEDGETESPNSVAETLEGGFILCGSFWYSSSNGYDVVLTKVNELGAMEWKEYYDLDENEGKADHGLWVEVAPDGGFLVTGDTQAFNPSYDYDAFIMKTTPLGTLESVITIGEDWPMYEGAYRLLQCSDGHNLICGYQNDDGLDNNWYVVKTGTSGWTHVIGGTYHEKAFNACETSDGGYAVTGNYHHNNSWNNFIVRYSTDGDTLWTKMWGDPDHSQCNYDIKQLDDGGFITVGSTAAAGGASSVYLTRLSAGTTGTEESSSGDPDLFESMEVHPNPFHGATMLTFNLKIKSKVTVSLFDMSGNRVSQQSVGTMASGKHEIPVGDGLAPGIYYCRLKTGSSSIVRRIVSMR